MTLPASLRWVLSAVFAVTGGYCLLRCAVPALAGPVTHRLTDRVADASHLAMSAAMVAMLWRWTGGDHWGGQLAVFAAFTGWYLVRATDDRHGRRLRVALVHQGMAMAAMFWMFYSMPAMSSTSMSSMPGMDMPATGHSRPLLPVIHLVTVGLAGYLALAALWWVRAATVAGSPRGGGLRVAFGPAGAATCQAVMAAAMCAALLASM